MTIKHTEDEQRLRDDVVEAAEKYDTSGRYENSFADTPLRRALNKLRDHRAKASTPVAPEPRCEPPEQYLDTNGTVHWLNRVGDYVVLRWRGDHGRWEFFFTDFTETAAGAYAAGWRYHSPASPVTRVDCCNEPDALPMLQEIRDILGPSELSVLDQVGELVQRASVTRVEITDEALDKFGWNDIDDHCSRAYQRALLANFAPTAAPVPRGDDIQRGVDIYRQGTRAGESINSFVRRITEAVMDTSTGHLNAGDINGLGAEIAPQPAPPSTIANELEQAPGLHPCPFCGGKAKLIDEVDPARSWSYCANCEKIWDVHSTSEPAPAVRREVSDEEIDQLWRGLGEFDGNKFKRQFTRYHFSEVVRHFAKHSPSITSAQWEKIRKMAITEAPQVFEQEARAVVEAG